MPNNKRPAKIKMDVVPAQRFANLTFSDRLGRGANSVYVAKMLEALNTGGAILINAKDNYLKTQFKAAAKKCAVRLVYAIAGEEMYIKPIQTSEDHNKLMLFLREWRGTSEMQGKYELDLNTVLNEGITRGVIKKKGSGADARWMLTAEGEKFVKTLA